MYKDFVSLLRLSLLICYFISTAWAQTKSEDVAISSNHARFMSFADIIEPVMPTVVNINTVKHGEDNENYKSLLEALMIDHLNHYLGEFNFPFSFDDITITSNSFALGSGVIVDQEGDIITNYHVVSGSDEIFIKLSDNREFPARIIGSDPKTDLALLKIEVPEKLPFARFGDSSALRVGDIVIAIGNALGFGGTVTTGIISSKGRDLGEDQEELVGDFIQTDAAINTGNSGGPLFDLSGQVIGINTSLLEVNGNTNIGIGFAIPANTVKAIMHQLKEKGKISRGRLDISVQQMTSELAEALSFNESYGVLVVNVQEGGVGDKAGLKLRDLILEFNGKKITNSRKLQLMVAECNIGDKIILTILRENKRISLEAQITNDDVVMPESSSGAVTENSVERSGVLFADLSAAIRGKFGIDSAQDGVVVLGTTVDASKLDFKAGDIITAIDDKKIQNIGQLSKIYQVLQESGKKNVLLLVKRGEIVLFVPLPLVMVDSSPD
jgi:serine protease Do